MSIMGIFNKSAGILAPLIFAAVVLRATDTDTFNLLEAGTLTEMEKNAMLDELIRRVIVPYAILAGLLLMVGIAIRYSVLPEVEPEDNSSAEQQVHPQKSKKTLLHFPYLSPL